jgi:hypothetical protein
MKKIISQFYKSQEQGFVLLFSLVVSAIIFLVGAGVFSLAFKELLVSSLAQESQKSIFAADSGVECALYTDSVNNTFDGANSSNPFSCFGISGITPEFNGTYYEFSIPFDEPHTCARVRVSLEDPEPGRKTVISQGYNKCTSNAEPVQYQGLTERVYKVTF